MVHRFKRFLKSFQSKHSTREINHEDINTSSTFLFHASTSTTLSTAELEARLETSGTLSSATSLTSTFSTTDSKIKTSDHEWERLLLKIPQLVAECTKANVENSIETFQALFKLLQQMAGRENQQRIQEFYAANASSRKVFRQCRRTLLLVWKYMIVQLHSNDSTISIDLRNLYFQLIGMIVERVEFHLLSNDVSINKTPKANGPKSFSFNGPKRDNENIKMNYKSMESFDETIERERDFDMYRFLLIATFQYAATTLDIVRQKRRSYISLAETRFFARVFAVCFFRVPVLQSAMLEEISKAYHDKQWLAENESVTQSGRSICTQTFVKSLERWFEILMKNVENQRTNEQTQDEDTFIHSNPTLFQWTRYAPYLKECPDSNIFSTQHGIPSWLFKLTHDGEFFSKFMGFLCLHIAHTALDSKILWTCLPGYTLLLRVSLLVLKEACWAKYLYVRDTCGPLPSSSIELELPSQETAIPFELASIRAIRTVLDNVIQLLRNPDLLDICILAMYECTNVLHARSVDVCLTRFEEWFCASAMLLDCSPSQAKHQIVYRLPPTFQGITFAAGIRVMLSSDHHEILGRTLLFLYHQMDYFDGLVRQNILKALVQRHMTLFLHWNEDVRTKYHHLLVYRCVRANRIVLESPIDHFLLGKNVLEPSTLYMNITATDVHELNTEQALWRAFDACFAVILHHERREAHSRTRKFQLESIAAQNRAHAFRTLNRKTLDDQTDGLNEGLPGGKPWIELEELDEALERKLPYYLRYLPSEEVAILDNLRHLAASVKYPESCQIYAAHSLRKYTNVLRQYYQDFIINGSVSPPALDLF